MDLPATQTPARVWLRCVVGAFLTLAVVQSIVVVTQAIVPIRLAGVFAAVASTAIASGRASRGRLVGLALIGAVAFVNFWAHVRLSAEPFFPRAVYVLVIYGYSALLIAAVVTLVLRDKAGRLFLSAAAIASVLLCAEAILGHAVAGDTAASVVWVGGTAPHPVLGEYYPPNSVARTIYPSNPRGYFRISDTGETGWELRLHHSGSLAQLSFPTDRPSLVRVNIESADVPTAWHIQLSLVGLTLRAGERYVATFRARADQPRPISYGVSQAHAPWDGLGWYRTTPIGPAWQEYREEFQLIRGDERARVIFDLGERPVSVEISDVQIRHVGSGERALKEVPAQSYVEYRFNSHGCRGAPDQGLALDEHRRILALGDSFTLGVGVHEEHTFSQQLEHKLNADAAARGIGVSYDVANCGVSGYSTREERLLYELVAPLYRPHIVVLAMVSNDDRSWRSDVDEGRFHQETKYERLFLIWRLIQRARHAKQAFPDFSGTRQEVLALRNLVARANARLAVVAFRTSPTDERWTTLVDVVSRALAGSDVPFLDLGDRMLVEHQPEDLMVHAVDEHPNEIAHELAARQIADLLRQHRIID